MPYVMYFMRGKFVSYLKVFLYIRLVFDLYSISEVAFLVIYAQLERVLIERDCV